VIDADADAEAMATGWRCCGVSRPSTARWTSRMWCSTPGLAYTLSRGARLITLVRSVEVAIGLPWLPGKSAPNPRPPGAFSYKKISA
jgi:hypothetical protein